MPHSVAYLNLRHDLWRVCAFVAFNALLANFLPDSRLLRKHHRARYLYEVFVDLVAGFGLNWRTSLPSLDQEFMGFKRIFRHAYRNWRQDRIDEMDRRK